MLTYKELLYGLEYTGTPPEGEAALIVQDSRNACEGAVFVCIEGKSFDGHEHAQKALDAGAGLIVTQHPLGIECEVTVQDTRKAYALLSQKFFGNPAEKLTLVAVTGTNGKTTVASVTKQMLENMGVPCALISTIQCEIKDVVIPAKFTTPDAFDTAALMARALGAGCTHLVMEASSQALWQGRLYGIHFALGIFTNLSQDHLDYHGSMQNYYEAKKLLFARCDAMLANIDDEAGIRLMNEAKAPVKKSFSTEKSVADFSARSAELAVGGVKFAFLGDGFVCPVRFAMPGGYSVQNALAALGAGVMLGFEPAEVAKAVSEIQGVRGRCEVVHSGEFSVIVDFAHTAEGIESLLAALRPYAKKRMVVLFGNAGQRDAGKRHAMGVAAAKYADEIFITADNPRGEDVMQTIHGSLAALEESGKPFTIEPYREKAVTLALKSLGEGDMLVLCGKGHEDYQVMAENTIYLNEREIVAEWLEKRGDT